MDQLEYTAPTEFQFGVRGNYPRHFRSVIDFITCSQTQARGLITCNFSYISAHIASIHAPT